ncbi:hypothetical protein [Paenalcaligenes sp.]|uniref:hypothetical protein n=1 Tax=Paenalcaligenes sp. TaxID=1966342 RepID=UPI0026201DD9|nr:hypothetical protein [Paenalcaligenes sp.]
MLGYVGAALNWIGLYGFLIGAIVMIIAGIVRYYKRKVSLLDNIAFLGMILFFLAVHFLVFKPFLIDPRKEQFYLAEHGVITRGCIGSLTDTSMYINGMPVLKMLMRYRFDDKAYETVVEQAIPYSILSEVRVGQCFALLVDPANPRRVVLH